MKKRNPFQKVIEANPFNFDLSKIRYKTFYIIKKVKGYQAVLTKEDIETFHRLTNYKEVSNFNKFNLTSTMEILHDELKQNKLVESPESVDLIISQISVVTAPIKGSKKDFVVSFSISSPNDFFDKVEGRAKAMQRLIRYGNKRKDKRDCEVVGTFSITDTGSIYNSFTNNLKPFICLSQTIRETICEYFAEHIVWLKDVKIEDIK